MRRGWPGGGRVMTPARLSNVCVWLKASVGVTTISGGVSRVEDLSGNGRHAVQTVTADRPTLTTAIGGKPTITMVSRSGGAAGQYLVGPDMLPWSGAAPRTVFVVYRSRGLPPVFTGYPFYAGAHLGSRHFTVQATVTPNSSPNVAADGVSLRSLYPVDLLPLLAEASYDGTTVRLAKNALAYHTAPAAVDMAGEAPYVIGARAADAPGSYVSFGNVDVAEIICMASQARFDEVARARAYLMGEYGIS